MQQSEISHQLKRSSMQNVTIKNQISFNIYLHSKQLLSFVLLILQISSFCSAPPFSVGFKSISKAALNHLLCLPQSRNSLSAHVTLFTKRFVSILQIFIFSSRLIIPSPFCQRCWRSRQDGSDCEGCPRQTRPPLAPRLVSVNIHPQRLHLFTVLSIECIQKERRVGGIILKMGFSIIL